LDYVLGAKSSADQARLQPVKWIDGADQTCFLCQAAATYAANADADRQLLVAARGRHSVVVLNRFPYNNGHVLVSPLRHVGDLADMTRDEHLECMEQLSRLTKIDRERLRAEGFNIGLNLGRVAGAGVPGHLHWHLVPRWPGDNNFMPVLAGTRVIPQSLEAVWEILVEALKD
jgi:ATP adenylyltransferase